MTDPAFTLPPEPEAYQRLLDAIHKARAHAIATESPFSATNSQAVDNLRDLCRLQLKALESGLFPPTEPPAKPEPLTNADLNPSDIVRFRGKEWRVQGIDDENPYIGLLLLDVAEPKDSPDFHGTDFPITRGSNRRPKDGYNRRWRWARAEDVELVSRGEHVLSPGEPEARVGGQGEEHPDDAAVDAFAAAMKAKLAEARAKGRGGWQDKSDCPQQRLSDMLRAHVEKGDPRDVANFACFLWNRGEGIAPRQPEARVGGEDCHCATCTCASGMTPAVRFDASPAEREGAVRDQLIAMGWTPPQQPAPVVPEGLTARDRSVLRFALHRFMGEAYARHHEASQKTTAGLYASGAAERFYRDAKDAERLLSVFAAAPEPGEGE